MLTNKEQRAFFELFIANKSSNTFTDRLKEYIEEAKHNTQWRMQFMTWERQQAYAYRDGKEEGIAIGEERGRAEGSRAKALEAARSMLSDGLDTALISRYTGLTPAEIAQLQ